MKFNYPLYVLGREDDYVTIQGNALLVFTEDWIAHAYRAGIRFPPSLSRSNPAMN